MTKKISQVLAVALITVMSVMLLVACTNDHLYGEYTDTDDRLSLVLNETDAIFEGKKYFVNYSDSANKIGINDDEWDCFSGVYDYTFYVNEDNSLTLKGYEAASDATNQDKVIDIILKKAPYVPSTEQ